MNPVNHKEDVPLAHYRGLYLALDPLEAAERTGLVYRESGERTGDFSLRLMGTEYRICFPLFKAFPLAGGPGLNPYEEILVLRYLCTGRYTESQGKQLSYNEIPWGKVYFRNFEGRCLKRLARTFGHNLKSFQHIMETWTSLKPASLKTGDAGYRFEFINGLFLGITIWQGDEEFSPSAQILFDDNFAGAFSAEDLAVAGEIVIRRLLIRENQGDAP